MSEEDTLDTDTITSEEVIDTLPESVDDPQVLKAELAKKDKTIRQIHARAIKAETLLKERTEPTAPITQTQSPVADSPISQDELDLRLNGYSKEDAMFILTNGGKKVLDDPNSLVSIALKARREQTEAERAASQTSDSIGLSEVERKYTPEQLANMSAKELEKILPHAN